MKDSKEMGRNMDKSDPEYLPTKTEKVKYLHNAGSHTSCLFGPFKQT